jgi:hypothetical protein
MNTTVGICMKLRRLSAKTKCRSARLVMLFLAVGSTLAGSAGAQTYDRVTTFPVRFLEIGPLDASRFGLKLWDGSTTPALCPLDTSGWAAVQVGILGATQEGLKAMLATAMAAKLSGLNLTVYAYNPQPGGGGNCMIGALDLGP